MAATATRRWAGGRRGVAGVHTLPSNSFTTSSGSATLGIIVQNTCPRHQPLSEPCPRERRPRTICTTAVNDVEQPSPLYKPAARHRTTPSAYCNRLERCLNTRGCAVGRAMEGRGSDVAGLYSTPQGGARRGRAPGCTGCGWAASTHRRTAPGWRPARVRVRGASQASRRVAWAAAAQQEASCTLQRAPGARDRRTRERGRGGADMAPRTRAHRRGVVGVVGGEALRVLPLCLRRGPADRARPQPRSVSRAARRRHATARWSL